MKKVVLLIATVMVAIGVNAASVAWSSLGMKSYAGNAYQVFVIGQNGVESIATVTDKLDSRSSTSDYAFASGVVGNTGLGSGSSSTELGVGTWTSFMVLFDATTPEAANNYIVLSGAAKQTQEVGSSTAEITFAAGSVAAKVGNSENWKAMNVPEPTSGLLLLIGGALLALRRKQK